MSAPTNDYSGNGHQSNGQQFNDQNGQNGQNGTKDNYEGKGSDSFLNKLDKAKFSWFHVKAVVISGVGFFTDAYDLFVISLVATMISLIYFNGNIRTGAKNALSGLALAGTLVGQVSFGYIGDVFGRKKIYMVSLVLMIIMTIFSAFAASFSDLGLRRSLGVVEVLCIYRFFLGIGIGGDYPLSAVITSEYSASMFRGTLIALVFSMQGIGTLAAAVVSIVVLKILEGKSKQISNDINYLDNAWRLIIGLGAVPAIATIYLRFMLPETPRYTLQVNNDKVAANRDAGEVLTGTYLHKEDDQKDISQKEKYGFKEFGLFLKQWGVILTGTAGSWFLLDVVYYSLQLYTPTMLTNIGYADPKKLSKYQYIFQLAGGQAIIALCGTIPGYYFTVALIDVWGRIPIQIMGFVMVTIICIIMAAAFPQISTKKTKKPNGKPAAFVILYCLLFFFCNFGPNATTFVIPGEVFPTKYRSTAHGLSAGAGKAGALIGAFGINASNADIGNQKTFGILAAVMFMGLCVTFLIPETKGKTLEELGEGSALRSRFDKKSKRQSKKGGNKGNSDNPLV